MSILKNTNSHQITVLKSFVANIIDVYDQKFIDHWCKDNKLSLTFLLDNSFLKYNITYCNLWHYIYKTYPSKREFQEFVFKQTTVDKILSGDFNIALDINTLTNIINSEAYLSLRLGFIKINGNELKQEFLKIVNLSKNMEYVFNTLYSKWCFRFGAAKQSNIIVNKENLLKTFIQIYKQHEMNIKSVNNNITSFYPHNIDFSDHDIKHLSTAETITFVMHRNNRFLLQLANHYLIVLYKANLPSSLVDIITKDMKRNMIILNVVDEECARNNENTYRFFYTLTTMKYKVLPHIASNMLLITSDPAFVTNDVWLCTNVAERIVYNLSNEILSCNQYHIQLTNNMDIYNPSASIYYMPQFKDVNLKGLENLLLKRYLVTKCPFKTGDYKCNEILYNNFLCVYLHQHWHSVQSYVNNLNHINIQNNKKNVIFTIDNRFNMLTFIAAVISFYNINKHVTDTSEFWRVHIFTSQHEKSKYESMIKTLFPTIPGNLFKVNVLKDLTDCTLFHMELYNQILKDSEFWKYLYDSGYKKCIVVQDDGMLINGSSISKFLDFDYVGAPWADVQDNVFIKKFVNQELVGNGGFSLRDIKQSLQVCQTFVAEKKELFYHNVNEIPEDVYFVKCMKTLSNSKIAPFDIASSFAVEQVYNSNKGEIVGFHKFWMYHSPMSALNIFKNAFLK